MEKLEYRKAKIFSAKYGDIAILLPIQVDEQLVKAIMPYLDPLYRCFNFNQEDMTLKYAVLFRIMTPNPNKVFCKKTKGARFVKKMS